MLVRKYEAKTMKEALEMVKVELGPEAIILAAKENTRGWGLAGEESVEVTAAVTESTLKKKKIAEAKLTQQAKEQFINSSAMKQKEFINKVDNQDNLDHEDSPARPRTETPYIDIFDDERASHDYGREIAAQRIQVAAQNAAQDALKAFSEIVEPVTPPQPIPQPEVAPVFNEAIGQKDQQIQALQNEISQLKQLIDKFSQVPQNFLSMHPGADEGLPFELSFMFKKLIDVGMTRDNAVELLMRAKNELPHGHIKKKAMVEAWVVKRMLDFVKVVTDPTAGRVHAFLGPAGQGKTSSVVKFATQLVVKQRKKIAIVTSDVQKVGAVEQLRIFSQILNVPFATIRSKSDWASIMAQLQGFDHILFDTPGSNLRTGQQLDSLRTILPPSDDTHVYHYVQSALAKDSDAFEIAERYKNIGFHDVIFNRLDECTQHGIIYNFQKRFSVPLHSFGIGPALPEDYEYATKERVIDLIFQLTKLRK